MIRTMIAEFVEDAAAHLAAAGIPGPRREARLLLALALGLPAHALVLSPERQIAPAEAENFSALLARRLKREPYSRIAGRREFWSLDLALSPDTLDPRPESETLIETALGFVADRSAPLEIVDFGTGTGALLLALLSEMPNATGIGIDLAPGAVEQARRNAATLGLSSRARFVQGDWGTASDGEAMIADMILANPPYIRSRRVAGLEPEVREYDPLLALDGGPDGLRSYRELAPPTARMLRKTGVALLEIGQGQGGPVAAIMAAAGLDLVQASADLSNIERCLVFSVGEKTRISYSNKTR